MPLKGYSAHRRVLPFFSPGPQEKNRSREPKTACL
jgi:hypothetical protein